MLSLLVKFRPKCVLKSEGKRSIHNILFQALLDAFQSLASPSELQRMALTSDEFAVLLRHFNY